MGRGGYALCILSIVDRTTGLFLGITVHFPRLLQKHSTHATQQLGSSSKIAHLVCDALQQFVAARSSFSGFLESPRERLEFSLCLHTDQFTVKSGEKYIGNA